jgi:hypothetical protein
MKLKAYILARLKERTTWLGIIGIATAFGCHLSPEQAQAIVTLGLGVAGLLHAAAPD